MRKTNTKDIALLAVMTSLILIFACFPISIGTVDMAFMALLPIIVVTQVKGLKMGLVLSAVFGLVSFIVSFSMRSVLSPVFQNPLVSILPRLFIGLTTYYSCKFSGFLFSKIKKLNPKVAESLKYGISGAIGVCTNTTLVLGMILLFYYGKSYGSAVIGWTLILLILSTNFIIELIVTTVLCIPISLALNKLIRIKTPVKIETKQENIVNNIVENTKELKEDNNNKNE